MENLLIADNQDITLTEKEVLEESQNSVRTIADNLLKTKAYYNALAANAVMQYLKDKGLLRGEIVNMHSSSKMLVDFEIADIQLPNLYIDVRAVFDENEIFIPKKHFENKLVPDIYLIMKLDDDLTNGTLLGFVEPAKINKQNQNDEYYFVNKSILTPPSKLTELINSFALMQQYVISESAELVIEKLIMLYMDHDIDDTKLEKLIDYLKNSVIAREKLIEFENFERLSYMALQEFKNLDVENNDFSKYIRTLVATDEFAQFDDKSDDLSELFGDETSQPKGLFVDDVVEAVPMDEPAVEEVPAEEKTIVDEEDLPLTKAVHDEIAHDEVQEPVEEEIEAEVFDDIEELAVPEENSAEVIEDTLEAAADSVSEEGDTSVFDEFDAFDAGDEFDIPDELLAEEEQPAAVEETHDVTQEPENAPDIEEISPVVDEAEVAADEVTEEIVSDETIASGETSVETLDPDTLIVEPAIEEENIELSAIDAEPATAIEEENIELSAIDAEPATAIEEENIELSAIDAEPATAIEEENIELPAVETEPEMTIEEEPATEDIVEPDETVITDEDINQNSENLTESLNSEDLELQLDEPVSENLETENIELEPIEEISLETPENVTEDIITDSAHEKEEPKELDVAQALDLDTVNLDSDTVIGLSEGIMDVKDVEDVQTGEPAPEETLSADELDNIVFDTENTEEEPQTPEAPSEESVSAMQEFEPVETVTDEDVENAIAQSQANEDKKEEHSSDIDLLMGMDNSSDADNLSLEELLSMENDLSASDDPHSAFHFSDSEDEDEHGDAKNATKTVAASAEELEMLAADLDDGPEAVIQDNTPKVEDTEDDEDLSNFAFAVDSRAQGNNAKKILIPVAALVTVLGLAGAGAWYFLSHGKSAAGTGSIDVDNIGTGGADIDLNNVVTPENPPVADIKLPAETAAKPAVPQAKKAEDKKVPPSAVPEAQPASTENNAEAAAPEPLTIQKIKKDFSQPNTYLSVSKIVWDVPEYLTYNDDFNTYLQTLGSTLKLNLSSDLLLISENTVFNKVKVKIELKDSGKKYSAELAEGCGTQVVDDLVLQSVKNTLNLLKPPVNSLETADEELFITIYL